MGEFFICSKQKSAKTEDRWLGKEIVSPDRPLEASKWRVVLLMQWSFHDLQELVSRRAVRNSYDRGKVFPLCIVEDEPGAARGDLSKNGEEKTSIVHRGRDP